MAKYTHVVKIYTPYVMDVSVAVFNFDIEHVVRVDAHHNMFIKTNDPHGARLEIEKCGLGVEVYMRSHWEEKK